MKNYQLLPLLAWGQSSRGLLKDRSPRCLGCVAAVGALALRVEFSLQSRGPLDGTLLDLSNFFIVMTSNIGASEAMEMRKSSAETVERVVFSLIKEALRPELVGRITEHIVFNRLEYDVQVEVAKFLLDREINRLNRQHACSITYEESVLELILTEGFDSRFGARPLRKCIERLVGNALVEKLLVGSHPAGSLTINGSSGALSFQ